MKGWAGSGIDLGFAAVVDGAGNTLETGETAGGDWEG